MKKLFCAIIRLGLFFTISGRSSDRPEMSAMKKFQFQIGDNMIELEGESRDDALKKVGLNPKHWQDNKGEKLEIKDTPNVNKKQPPVANIAKKRPIQPLKVEVKQTSFRRKPNITTDDIGKWYTDGIDVWRLEDFIPEPQVSMSKVASESEIKKGNLSDFSDFRRLVPEPEPRKRPKKKG